jgi:hypothetical protein
MINKKPFNLIIEGLLVFELILLTIMQIEKYQVETTVDSLIYTFESVGKTTIKKVVEYTKVNPIYFDLPSNIEVYNLGFGDWDDEINDFRDKITSNNGDMEKVLVTVANTVFSFWENYPDASVFFQGSQIVGEEPLRAYLYQRKIERYFEEISNIAYVFGKFDGKLEIFTKGKTYSNFLIIRKS